MGIYPQDKWTLTLLTLNVGARFDYPTRNIKQNDYLGAKQQKTALKINWQLHTAQHAHNLHEPGQSGQKPMTLSTRWRRTIVPAAVISDLRFGQPIPSTVSIRRCCTAGTCDRTNGSWKQASSTN